MNHDTTKSRSSFSILLVVALVFTSILSIHIVSAQDAAAEPTEVVIWDYGIGDVDYGRQLTDRFNAEHPNINLVFDPALAGLASLTEKNQKLRIVMENGSGPDIVGDIDVGANLEALVVTGQVKDLTEAYETYGWNERIPQNLIEQVTIDGRIYGAPQTMESVGLFYNKDLFDELGLEEPETYDDYLAVLEALKTAGYYGYAIGLAGGWPSAFMASEFMYSSAGSEYIDVLSAIEPWTDCANCLLGVEAFNNHVVNGYANPEPLAINQDQANDLFYQGKTAMVLSGSWLVATFENVQPDFDIGFFYLPPVNPDTDILALGGIGSSLVVADYAPEEATMEVLQWLLSEELAVDTLRNVGRLPAFPIEVPDDIDPLINQLATETVANFDAIGFWPVTYLAPQVFGEMNQIVQGMIGGQLTPEQLLEEMQRAHSSYLAENGGS